MTYRGDFKAGSIIDFKFNTRDTDGAPITLAGTPSLAAYKDNSVTQDTDGLTLSVDFDSVTGLHNVRVDTSADPTFYADGSSFQIVLAAGTVDAVSVVGAVVGEFTLGRTTANVTKVNDNATAASNLEGGARGLVRGTVGTSSSTTSVTTNLTEATDDHYNGRYITFITGALAGQSSEITDYNGSTKALTVVALTEAPANTDLFVIS